MKFIADMGVSPKVIHLLQSFGHQAVHLQTQGLHRLKDTEILEKARKEGSKIPELLLMISKGDEIIIEKNSRPFAKLTAITGPGGRRIPGLHDSIFP